MKTVLILSPTTVTGGGTIFCKSICEDLKGINFEVHFIGPNEGKMFEEIGHFCQNILDKNLRYFSFKDLLFLFLYIKRYRIEIVHSNGRVPGIYCYVLSFLFPKLNFIHSFHGFHVNHLSKLKKIFVVVLEKFFLKTRITRHYVSDSEFARYINLVGCPKFYKIIHNTNFREVYFRKKSKKNKTNRDYFLYLGRVTPFKNVKFIVENVINYRLGKKNGENICLKLVGDVFGLEKLSFEDINYRNIIIDMIETKGAKSYITLEPAKSNILDELLGAKALILASEAEGAPLVLFEAMSVSTPVLGANVDGIKDFITHGESGLLYTPGDNVSFIAQLENLMDSKDISASYGANSLYLYEKKYSNQIFFNKIRELYLE
jgi:glycosyltransferase involved in cell wall biosynthesis